MPTSVPVMIITGPVGVGKTTVASEVSELLEQAQIAHAFVDLDALRWCYPRQPRDRFSTRLAMKNLAAVWANFRAYGAASLVVADVIESRSELDHYRAAIPGADIFVVRLSASLNTLADRLKQRELGAGLAWHLQRAPELTAIMERNKVEDLLVTTDGKTVAQIAREILQHTRWMKWDE
ncbi:MAG TPA: AAA family ATPase [Ktedonobacteraceae bacterium]|nr:AAA family ATPase [Ktedonobacteraceae bacterium]